MKTFNIFIEKAKIFATVALNTAYTGAKADNPEEVFEKVATISADNKLLSNLWNEMIGLTMEKLKPFIASVNISDSSFSMVISISNSYDDSQTATLNDDLHSAFSAGITARWFRFSSPAKAADWEGEANRSLDSALSKLCFRKPPRRRS